MAAAQNPGETLPQYRIRMLEDNYAKLDAKLDTVISGLSDVKHVTDDLVAGTKTKTTNASTLRIGVIVGLIVAGGGTLVGILVTAVNAYLTSHGGAQ